MAGGIREDGGAVVNAGDFAVEDRVAGADVVGSCADQVAEIRGVGGGVVYYYGAEGFVGAGVVGEGFEGAESLLHPEGADGLGRGGPG